MDLIFNKNYAVPGQMSIFDFGNDSPKELPIFKIDKPIRLIELFAGVGTQAMALERLGANFTRWKVVEFDKYAIKSYNAIHGTDFPITDIRDVKGSDLEIVDTDKYCYILFYSFPCTDLSVAGKQLGMSKDSGTRSGLLWEVERLLNEVDTLPQVLVMENVPQVHGKRNADDFQSWLNFLSDKGYRSYWKDLNAKNFNVAQSRNRTFCVSILGDYRYEFPEEIELKHPMRDYLDDEVDEKYYIDSEKANSLILELEEDGKLNGSTCLVKNKESGKYEPYNGD